MWFYYSLFFAFWTSISMLITKKLTGKITPFPLIFVIVIFAIPFMLLIIFFQGGFPKISPEFYFLMIPSSLIDVVAAVASIQAIKKAEISLISPISSFNPVFTTVIAALFINEKPNTIKLLGILVVMVGSYLLNIKDIKSGIFKPFYNLFSNRGAQLFLLANFLWAITPIFQKNAIFQTQPQMPLFPSLFGATLIALLILPLAFSGVQKEIRNIKSNVLWFLILGLFGAIAQLAAFTAFSLNNLGYVTAIFKISTLFTILWGWIFFKEKRIGERLIGASVMILGTALLVL